MNHWCSDVIACAFLLVLLVVFFYVCSEPGSWKFLLLSGHFRAAHCYDDQEVVLKAVRAILKTRCLHIEYLAFFMPAKYACMHACMHVCKHACMYSFMYLFYLRMHLNHYL